MAYDAKKKAKIVAELLGRDKNGDGWDAIAKKHGISKGTLSNWVREAKRAIREPDAPEAPETITPEVVGRGHLPNERDRQKQAFTDALMKLLFKSIVMLDAWAEECANPKFIKDRPAEVNELGKTVLAYSDRLVPFVVGESGKEEGEDLGE